MKKYLFLIVMAVAVAAGCTKSGLIETPQSQSGPISFDPYLGKAPVTKAANSDLTFLKTARTSNLYSGGFQVYAFLHGANDAEPATFTSPYMNEEVWWEADKWEYDKVTYWPEGSKLAFAAFGLNASKGGCLLSNNGSLVDYTFNVKEKVSEQVDLIVAPYQTGLSTGNVSLNFKHLLSRVGFKIMSSDATAGVDIAIRSIKLCGKFNNTATIDITKVGQEDGLPYFENKDGLQTEYMLFEDTDCFKIASTACSTTAQPIYPNATLSGTTYSDKYVQGTDEEQEDFEARVESAINKRYMMIMPGTMPASKSEAYIEVQYQLTSDEPRIAKVEIPSLEFKQGYAYEFILKVSTSAIVFDAEMTENWGDPVGPTEPLPLSPEA